MATRFATKVDSLQVQVGKMGCFALQSEHQNTLRPACLSEPAANVLSFHKVLPNGLGSAPLGDAEPFALTGLHPSRHQGQIDGMTCSARNSAHASDTCCL